MQDKTVYENQSPKATTTTENHPWSRVKTKTHLVIDDERRLAAKLAKDRWKETNDLRNNRFTGLRDLNDDNINVNDGSEKPREQPEVIEIDNLTGCTTYRTGWEHKKSARNTKATVVGDSMVKELRQDRISRSSNDKVIIRCFPGATTDDMKDYIKPIVKWRNRRTL